MRLPPALVVPLGLIRSKGVVLGAVPILGRGNLVILIELRAGDGGVRFRVKIQMLRSNVLHGLRVYLVRLNRGQFIGLNGGHRLELLL